MARDVPIIEFPTLTGEVVALKPDDICEIAYGDRKIIKSAGDLNKGDVVLNIIFSGKNPTMQLENAVPLLYESFDRYRSAYDFWHISFNGHELTRTQFQLYSGMEKLLTQEMLIRDLDDLLDILTNDRRISELRQVEERVRTEIINAVDTYNVKRGYEPEDRAFLGLSEEMIENWIRGNTLMARDLRIYESFTEYAKPTKSLLERLIPSWLRHSEDTIRPDWNPFSDWNKESSVYAFWSAIKSYHIQFSRVLGEHGIEIISEESGSGGSGEARPSANSGYAQDVRTLLWKMGVKKNDSIAIVIKEQPRLRMGKAHLDDGLKFTRGKDQDIVEEYPGQLINENNNLMTALVKTGWEYLRTNYDGQDKRTAKFENDINYATWKFIHLLIPGDPNANVNLKYRGVLNKGYGFDEKRVDELFNLLIEGYNSGELDSYLLDAYAKRGLDSYMQAIAGGSETKFKRVESFSSFMELYPSIGAVVNRLFELRPAMPARFGELLSVIYKIDIAEMIHRGQLSGIDEYRLTGRERSQLRIVRSDLSQELGRQYGGGNIVMD
jgi:hypothetical protein